MQQLRGRRGWDARLEDVVGRGNRLLGRIPGAPPPCRLCFRCRWSLRVLELHSRPTRPTAVTAAPGKLAVQP